MRVSLGSMEEAAASLAAYIVRAETAIARLAECRGIGGDEAHAVVNGLVIDGHYTLEELADWIDAQVAGMCGVVEP